jgi:RNA polymerase sigma-70 factor, ECF subfamily
MSTRQQDDMQAPDDISGLIALWRKGDKTAENALFAALYNKLRGIAINCLRSEPRERPLGATTLVHEAYLRLQRSEKLAFNDRSHFLALVGQVMRRIIIDQARARKSYKRGGDLAPVDIEHALLASDAEADQILAVDRALESLSKHSPRQAQIVELRYFAGFDEEEAATILNVSARTIRRDWQIARTRLRVAIDGPAGPPPSSQK